MNPLSIDFLGTTITKALILVIKKGEYPRANRLRKCVKAGGGWKTIPKSGT